MYTLWVAALLEACDVIQDGGQYGRQKYVCYLPKIRSQTTTAIKSFDARHVKYDISKLFATFCEQFVPFLPKKGKNTYLHVFPLSSLV